MSRSGNPYVRFFINDHEGELTLRGSSLAVRSLWLSMVFLMERGTPRGYLRLDPKSVKVGGPTPDPTPKKVGGPTHNPTSKKVGGPTPDPNSNAAGGPNLIPANGSLEANLFAILGLPETDRKTFADAMHELEQRGVFSRDEKGVIYCRRIIKEEKYKEAQAKWGKLGAAKRHQNEGDPSRKKVGGPTSNPAQKKVGGPTPDPTSQKAGGPDSIPHTTYINSPQPPSNRGGLDKKALADKLKDRRKAESGAQ